MSGFEEAYQKLLDMIDEEPGEQWEPLAPLIERAVRKVDGRGSPDLMHSTLVLLAGARLLEKRARLLLPPEPSQDAEPEPEEAEEEDGAEELALKLLQYRGFKEMAEILRRYEAEQGRRFPSGGDEVEPTPGAGLEGVTIDELIAAFQRVWAAVAKQEPQRIPWEKITVAHAMDSLLTRLREEGEIAFSALFAGRTTRREVVVTFLALLELFRLRKVRVIQDDPFAEIMVVTREEAV